MQRKASIVVILNVSQKLSFLTTPIFQVRLYVYPIFLF